MRKKLQMGRQTYEPDNGIYFTHIVQLLDIFTDQSNNTGTATGCPVSEIQDRATQELAMSLPHVISNPTSSSGVEPVAHTDLAQRSSMLYQTPGNDQYLRVTE